MNVKSLFTKSNAVAAGAATVSAFGALAVTKGSSTWIQGAAVFATVLVALPIAKHFAG